MSQLINPIQSLSSLIIASLDLRYLKLTADNDPVTGQLDINVATATSSALVLKSTDDSLTNYLFTLKDSTSTDRFSVYSNGQATFSLPANVWDNDVAGVYIGTSPITDTTEKGFVTIVNDGTTSNTDPKRDSFAITRSGAANNINITNYASTPVTADSRIFWRRARGTRGTPLAVANGDRVGAFIFSGHDGTNFLGQSGGWIAVVDGAVSTGVVPIAVRLETGTYFSARVIGFMQSSTGAVSVNSSFQLAPTTNIFTLYGSASQSVREFELKNSSSTVVVGAASFVSNDDSINFFKVVGTMPTVPTNGNGANGVVFDITSTGSAAISPTAVRVTLEAGYTGTLGTVGMAVTNLAAGTSQKLSAGNFGLNLNALSVGSGLNIASRTQAGNSTFGNIGTAGRAFTDTAGFNIGLFGIGRNTTGQQIGVFAGMLSTNTYFPSVSGALIADNNDQAVQIFGAYDNGTQVFTIADGGDISTTNKIVTYNNIATEGYGVPAIVDDVALTAQVADITTTNFTNGGTAGTYRLNYTLLDTTADLTAGSITLTISWTDGAGATTVTNTQLLTGVGRVSGINHIQLASGNITYAVAHTGIYGTAVYALYMSLERLK